MHTCGKCGSFKPIESFYRRKSGEPHSPCKDCRRDYRPQYTPVSEKHCSTCLDLKPATDFRSDPRKTTGLKSECRACERQRRPKSIFVPAEKQCSACKNVLPASRFYRTVHETTGLTSQCRSCMYRRALENQKRYRAERAEHYRELHRQWVAENPRSAEQLKSDKERLQIWDAAHPGRKAVREQKRRARKAAVLNDFTAEQWDALKIAYRYRCAYCGEKPKNLTMDHVIPISKGGPHTLSNIVPACKTCNTAKGARQAPSHQTVLFA